MAVILNDADVFQPPTWAALSEDTKTERERCLKHCDWAIRDALRVNDTQAAQRLIVLRAHMERN